jgi:hypothetical protein
MIDATFFSFHLFFQRCRSFLLFVYSALLFFCSTFFLSVLGLFFIATTFQQTYISHLLFFTPFDQTLLSATEQLHTIDVQRLFVLLYLILLVLFGLLFFLFGTYTRIFLRRFCEIYFILLCLFSSLLLSFFSSSFVLFHTVLFSNDNWLLQPTDYLIYLFPESFFYTCALFILCIQVVCLSIIYIIVRYTPYCIVNNKA